MAVGLAPFYEKGANFENRFFLAHGPRSPNEHVKTRFNKI